VPNGVVGITANVIPDRLTVGFAAYDPFVGGGDYSGSETGKTPPFSGHQRYHIVDTAIISLALAPAAALTVVDGLHIGGSFNYHLDSISVMQASDPLGTEGILPEQVGQVPPDDPQALDTLLSGDATGSHIGASGGIFFDKFDKAQIGASYTSGGRFKTSGDGSVVVPETLSTEPGGVTVPAEVSIELPLPAVARLYVRSQLNDKLMVGGGIDWQLWNVCCGDRDGDINIHLISKDDKGKADESIGPDDGVTISIAADQYNPRRTWNSMNFVLMSGLQLTDELWLGARGGYNQNAVPDYAVTPTNLDFANVPVVLGGRYQLGGSLTLGLSYSKFFLITRDIKDSAWNLQDGNDRFSPSLPYKTNANGTYKGQVDTLGVRIGMAFGGES